MDPTTITIPRNNPKLFKYEGECKSGDRLLVEIIATESDEDALTGDVQSVTMPPKKETPPKKGKMRSKNPATDYAMRANRKQMGMPEEE